MYITLSLNVFTSFFDNPTELLQSAIGLIYSNNYFVCSLAHGKLFSPLIARFLMRFRYLLFISAKIIRMKILYTDSWKEMKIE